MLVAPSILSCDFAHGEESMKFVQKSGADWVHVDVMDGVFVPNLSFGIPVIKAFRPYTDLPFDTHLMMQYPARLMESFAKAGSDSLNIHVECSSPVEETLDMIRKLGKKTAITLKPATPAEMAFPFLDAVDMVLVMTVEPGFGGQSFMADMLPKIAALRAEIDRRQLSVLIEADGGINADTAPLIAKAGADVAVMGSAFFQSPDAAALVDAVHRLTR